MLLKLYGEMNRNFVLVLDSYLVTLALKFTQTSREKGEGGSHSTINSVLALLPAAPGSMGSIPGILKFFFLNF